MAKRHILEVVFKLKALRGDLGEITPIVEGDLIKDTKTKGRLVFEGLTPRKAAAVYNQFANVDGVVSITIFDEV